MIKEELTTLSRASCPEQVGISSRAVVALLKELETVGYEYHSFMALYKGVVAAECYRYPFSATETHCMYSISKHVTATALGFAVSEGKISLDTKICEIFPDKMPKKDPLFKETTIRHLVTMTAGKNPSALTDKRKPNWFEQLSECRRVSAPGEQFKYVNECAYVLSACLKKVLGEGINDYLTPRLWEPLGIEKPFWETDSRGVEAGGWGIQLKTEDLAKLSLCYYNGGVLFGRQILPSEWAKQATAYQSVVSSGEDVNTAKGYGYSFWRYTDTLWHFEGMYGQEAHVFEDLGLILVVTSGDFAPKRKNEYFRKYAKQMIIDADEKATPSAEYTDFIGSRALDVYPKSEIRSPLEKTIEGKTWRLKKHPLLNAIGLPLSVLAPATVFMSKNRAGNINDVQFCFSEQGCTFSWSEKEERNTVLCNMNGGYYKSKMRLADIELTAYSAARWLDSETLEISIRPMQTIAKRVLTFRFADNRLTMSVKLSPPVRCVLESVAYDVMKGIRPKALQKALINVFLGFDRYLEPKTKGKKL